MIRIGSALLLGCLSAVVSAQSPAPVSVPGSGNSAGITSNNREQNAGYNRVVGKPDPQAKEQPAGLKGKAVAAKAEDLKPGSPIRDKDGLPVGSVASVDAQGVVVDTGTTKIRVPARSFRQGRCGPAPRHLQRRSSRSLSPAPSKRSHRKRRIIQGRGNRRLVRVLAASVAIVSYCPGALAETTQEIVNKAPNGLALTPPMGWNSWNKFACDVTEDTVRSERRRDGQLGHARRRLSICHDRRLLARASATPTASSPRTRRSFPSGMNALADYIHSQGPEVRHLFRCRPDDVRQAPGQPGPRISGCANHMRAGASTISNMTGAPPAPAMPRKPMR